MILPGMIRPMMMSGGLPPDPFSISLATGANLQSTIDASGVTQDLIFAKNRQSSSSWIWRNSASGLGLQTASNATSAESAFSGYSGAQNHVAYTFRKEPGFFDVVTYVGDGVAGRAIPHSLGVEPGIFIVKCVSTSGDWFMYHRELGASAFIYLNYNSAASGSTVLTNGVAPTSSDFTVGSNVNINGNGRTFIAYLFAHDPGSDIACGSYTGNGSTIGPIITLGWRPQFVMVKASSHTGDWTLVDAARSPSNTRSLTLNPTVTAAEASNAAFDFSSTGFRPSTTDVDMNGNGRTYIYMAIREP